MAKIIKVQENRPVSGDELQELAVALKGCKILAFPTDTVYGLGGTGLIKAASRRIYQIKGREAMKPLPILVKSTEAAKRWVIWTDAAEKLARKFWPGPLTLVLRPTQEGRLLTFAEFPTLGIRVPSHPAILSVLEAADVPMASTSANLSGQPAMSEGDVVSKEFDKEVDYVIDAGRVSGSESTVVDASATPVRVLREGKVPKEQVLAALQ